MWVSKVATRASTFELCGPEPPVARTGFAGGSPGVQAGSVLDLQPMISVLFITDAAKIPPNANGKGQSHLCYL
jgi:hypothetical protein